jgi:hypothetical protein
MDGLLLLLLILVVAFCIAFYAFSKKAVSSSRLNLEVQTEVLDLDYVWVEARKCYVMSKSVVRIKAIKDGDCLSSATESRLPDASKGEMNVIRIVNMNDSNVILEWTDVSQSLPEFNRKENYSYLYKQGSRQEYLNNARIELSLMQPFKTRHESWVKKTQKAYMKKTVKAQNLQLLKTTWEQKTGTVMPDDEFEVDPDLEYEFYFPEERLFLSKTSLTITTHEAARLKVKGTSILRIELFPTGSPRIRHVANLSSGKNRSIIPSIKWIGTVIN